MRPISTLSGNKGNADGATGEGPFVRYRDVAHHPPVGGIV